jgi:hypothetical protein
MEFSLVFDALIAVLLIATIVYAAVLNRKLGALRDAKGEMETLLASFAESTERAGNGIELLKQEAGRSGAALQNQLNAARGLVDDLGFLIERGTSLAQRIDGGVETTRVRPAAAKTGSGPESAGESGFEIGAAAAAAPAKGVPAEVIRDTVAEVESSDPTAPVSRVSKPGAPVQGNPNSGAKDLSAAESELLKALQGMR